MPNSIVLASRSPRRKKLLSLIYPDFIIQPADIDEEIPFTGDPDGYVTQLSESKAMHVCNSRTNTKELIIGSDTIVVQNKRLLSKPKSVNEAFEMLTQLSGNTHDVYTGITLIEVDGKQQKMISKAQKTEVTFHQLSDNEIHAYIKTGSPMDKAGSYGIQDDWGALFVKEIRGDYYNVVGFPLQLFYSLIKSDFPTFMPEIK